MPPLSRLKTRYKIQCFETATQSYYGVFFLCSVKSQNIVFGHNWFNLDDIGLRIGCGD